MIKIIKDLTPKGEKYYFAVSMGVDSVAAYFWMKMKGYDVTPLHFNHHLRVQNDLMESKFVELCEATNAPKIIGHGVNLKTEKECRDARIKFYSSVVEEGANILTAHHLNDWVESYLMNCFRGHPNHTAISFESYFNNFTLVHPFLLSRKSDFVQFAERNNLMRFVVTDETNSEIVGSRRNWVRNVIVPEMTNQELSLEKFAERRIKRSLKKVCT